MTHQDQTIEQPINTAMITMLEACGFQVLRAPAGDHHLVKGTLESAAAFYRLTVAGADADAAQQAAPVAGREPVAWLKEWDSVGRAQTGMRRVDLTPDCEQWLKNMFPKITPLYTDPAPVASAQPDADEVASASALTYPATLTADLAEIMGMPNFQCAPIAHVYRDAGLANVARKAEAEQAFVIDKLVRFVIAHGADWRKRAQEELNQARAAYVAKKTVPAQMTQERFNEKMDALNAANPGPLERLMAAQGGKGSTP